MSAPAEQTGCPCKTCQQPMPDPHMMDAAEAAALRLAYEVRRGVYRDEHGIPFGAWRVS